MSPEFLENLHDTCHKLSRLGIECAAEDHGKYFVVKVGNTCFPLRCDEMVQDRLVWFFEGVAAGFYNAKGWVMPSGESLV